MPKNTPINVRVQPPEDLIDYPVSDTFRDHYAAQGLTYPSGRYPRKTARYPQGGYAEQTKELDTLRRELSIWKSRFMLCQQENDDLKSQLHQQRSRWQQSEKAEAVFEPVVVG